VESPGPFRHGIRLGETLEVLHEGNEGRNRNLLSWAGGVDQPEPEPAADRLDGRAKDQGGLPQAEETFRAGVEGG
jgi:hypothetical protein